MKKIISGGQTGIDRMGLEVARELDLGTGGIAPKGFKTEFGPDLTLATFGLREHTTDNYNHRTELNVMFSDGTIIFGNKESAGTKSTIKFLVKHTKPYLINPSVEEIKDFIKNKEIINIAGNRKSKIADSDLNNYREVLKQGLS